MFVSTCALYSSKSLDNYGSAQITSPKVATSTVVGMVLGIRELVTNFSNCVMLTSFVFYP